MRVKEIVIVDENTSSGFRATGQYQFKCPGCNDYHVVATASPQHNGAIWGFNGNIDKPTFTPSLLIRSGHYVPGYENKSCWCTYQKEHPDEAPDFGCNICHSFITDGKIQYLNDCTHKLAGQTIDLPEII